MKGQIAVILALVAASIAIISCNNAANEPKDAVQAALEAYKYVPDTTIKAPLFDLHIPEHVRSAGDVEIVHL